jgi:Virulence-associated protein E
VFFATTNSATYLKSQTGNRRFWPIQTGVIDIEKLKRDRDQLWAEVAYLEATGASLTLPAGLWTSAGDVQEARRDGDPWDDILADVKGTIMGGEERIATKDLFSAYLDIPAERRTDWMMRRLTLCMERLGWEHPKNPIRIGSDKVRGFKRTATES